MKKSKYRYPLAQSTFTQEEIDAAKSVHDSGNFTMGREVEAFESEFAKWIGAKNATMVNSGSSANLLMIEALLRPSKGAALLKVGDEVLVPALTWPTTVWPLLQLGLVPVYVDIDPLTMALDLDSAKACLTAKTKAIFIVHILGQVAEIGALKQFCQSNKLLLVEDACESLGAHHSGTHAGTFGLMGSFSCYFSHHISTIEGGVVTTASQKFADDLRSLRSHGWIRDRSDRQCWESKSPSIDPRYLFIMSGYNLRPTEIQAAIGRIQLERLDHMLELRSEMAMQTNQLIKKHTPWMRLIGAEHLSPLGQARHKRKLRTNSWMTLPFLIQKDSPSTPAQVKALFEEKGIETRPIIAGNLQKHPASKKYGIRTASSLYNANKVFKYGFMIGCHPLSLDRNLSILKSVLKLF